MANSTTIQYPSGAPDYRIPFDYLARPFVVVTLVNSADTLKNRVLVPGNDYRFTNATVIQILTSQEGFDIVQLHRYTQSELVVDFRDGSVLTAKDLTNAELQAIHIAEEGRDLIDSYVRPAVDAIQDGIERVKEYRDETKEIHDDTLAIIQNAGDAGTLVRLAQDDGATLVGYRFKGLTQAVRRSIRERLSDTVSVKDCGAKGNGSTDDTDAIQVALNLYKRVWFPEGVYPVSRSLIFSNQEIIGAGAMSGPDRGTILQATARNFEMFKRATNGYSPGGRIKGFYINYGPEQPTSAQDPQGKSCGINFGPQLAEGENNGSPMFMVEDVIVRGAYYGFFDMSSTYLMGYRNCWAYNCSLGWRKHGGTTINFDTCYALNCYGSWWVTNCYVVTYSNCAFDGTVTNQGFKPFLMERCRSVTINGMDHENGSINNAGQASMWFTDCMAASIDGFVVIGHKVKPTTGETYLIRFDGTTQGTIHGVRNESCTSAGAKVYGVLAAGSSKIKAAACSLSGWTGAGTGNNVSFGTAGTGIIIKDETNVYNGLLEGRVWMNGCVGSVTTTLTNVAVPANNLTEIGSLTLTGVLPTDSLSFSFDGDMQRCIFQARYVGANTVNFTLFNITGTARTVTGSLTIYASRFR